jgi:predicted RNase H-like HicB family nuclease
MRSYVGLIHKDAHSDFGVSFPDFPGVITAGTDLDDARALPEDVLAQIDKYAQAHGFTRSGLLAPAAKKLIA